LKFQERQHKVVKHATGHFGNHKKLNQWNLQDQPKNPQSTLSNAQTHIYPQIEHLAHQKAHPTPTPTGHPLPVALMAQLHPYYLPFRFENDDITSAMLNQQDDMGWYPFLLGHLSHY
jgi:hypothetical protein